MNRNTFCNSDPADLAAAINVAVSAMAKGKNVDELEIMAHLFCMVSDTFRAIAKTKRHQERLCQNNNKNDNNGESKKE